MIDNTVLLWVLFNGLVLLLLALDLGVFHRGSHSISIRESLLWSAVWTALALAFNLGIFMWLGYDTAMEFMAGYLIERALSVDNLFVFLMIFTYFRVPDGQQYKVLFWGILVALIMRGVFIATGITLIARFDWLIYIFGAFLILTGIKIAWQKENDFRPDQNHLVRLFRRLVPTTDQYHEGRFITRKDGALVATPLLLVLVAVEVTDLIFAMDSIPAVLAITLDPFVVYTSNVFAILGLRALYFALAGCAQIFCYLNRGVTLILIFVGAKMVLSEILPIPPALALGVVAAILLISILASLARPLTPNCPDQQPR